MVRVTERNRDVLPELWELYAYLPPHGAYLAKQQRGSMRGGSSILGIRIETALEEEDLEENCSDDFRGYAADR